MTLSVTIYFPAHCGHTGLPDWGMSHRAACGWSHVHVDCGPVQSCGPVPFAVTALKAIIVLHRRLYGEHFYCCHIAKDPHVWLSEKKLTEKLDLIMGISNLV